jgi:3-dehydroquinate synthase
MRTLDVTLPSGSYPIHIGAGVLRSHLPGLVARATREAAVVVTNETLARLYPALVEDVLRETRVRVATVVLPDGERFKSLDTLATIYDALMAAQANRKTALIAFGGGVVGDMAGFAAATFMRGMPLIQVPTTLLAQVDSSVGGKTAVNHRDGKNAIGAFKQPLGVVMELEFLTTLPERERRAGLFELFKHGIIRDRALFDDLAAGRALLTGAPGAGGWDFWEDAIERSCRVKAAVVEEDEKEEHVRAILNFGHTLAHLVETHTGYAAYLHGEAVGVGMLFAAFASHAWGLLPAAELERIRAVLEPLVTPVRLPPLDEARFAELLLHDKKAAGRSLRFIVLEKLGRAALRDGTTPAELWPLFQRFLAAQPQVLRLQAA